MENEPIDLLIIGAGPAGLLTGIIATQLGLNIAIIEQRGGLHPEPSAHVLKAHTMEVYRRVGVAESIFAESTPTNFQRCVTWCESLSGLCYGSLNLEGKKGAAPRFARVSPVYPANVPQNVVEPLLHARLKVLAGKDPVRFGHRLVDFTQDRDGVNAEVADAESTRAIRARFIIGADGAGSRVRRCAGIRMEGPPALAHYLAIHIRSDARPLLERFPGVVFFIRAPDISGFFIMHQPVGSQVFMLRIDPERTPPESFDEASCRTIVNKVIGQEHDYEISSIDSWIMSAQIAETYREGRAFLIGDAGHRFPPTGGLGLNTGVEDVENLMWKINAVLRGKAEDALLDTYELESRPIAIRNTQQSVKNSQRMQIVEVALQADRSEAALAGVIDELKRDSRHPRFSELQRAVDDQIDHFAYLELDMAARVNRGAFVPTSRRIPTPVPPTEGYVPQFAPGNHVPHFWLEPELAVIDCLGFDRFTLLVPRGHEEEWRAAVNALDDRFLPVHLVALSGDMRSEQARVADYWGEEPFAVLVRPDGRIGWVEPNGRIDRAAELCDALGTISAGVFTELMGAQAA